MKEDALRGVNVAGIDEKEFNEWCSRNNLDPNSKDNMMSFLCDYKHDERAIMARKRNANVKFIDDLDDKDNLRELINIVVGIRTLTDEDRVHFKNYIVDILKLGGAKQEYYQEVVSLIDSLDNDRKTNFVINSVLTPSLIEQLIDSVDKFVEACNLIKEAKNIGIDVFENGKMKGETK